MHMRRVEGKEYTQSMNAERFEREREQKIITWTNSDSQVLNPLLTWPISYSTILLTHNTIRRRHTPKRCGRKKEGGDRELQ